MKNILALLIVTFSTLCAYSQKDTIIYYSKTGSVTDSNALAHSYDQVKKMTDKVCFLERYIKKGGKWIHEGDDKKLKKINDSTFLIFSKITSPTDTIFRIAKKVKSGYSIKDYQNKVLVSTGSSSLVIPLLKEGKWFNYYRSTQKIKSQEEYADNQMISNKRWKASGEEDISNVFLYSDKDAEFQGGHDKLLTFLSTGIKFPGKAKRHGEQGTVTAQFVVMEDGTINGVEIIKGVSPSLDAESIRVVKSMPQWTPAMTNDKNVRVLLQVPFQFSLPKN